MATIEQNLTKLVNAKTSIANAITAKGGTVAQGDGFEEFPADIGTIPAGGGGAPTSWNCVNPNFTIDSKSASRIWTPKSWNGLSSFLGSKVWTLGSTVFYSSGSTQYRLDKSTSTWSTFSWQGYTSLQGNNIWTDGTDTYYSNGSTQYVLSAPKWNAKTWTGLTNFYGYNVWTDGTDIYYSDGSTQYVLDKTTSTWSSKTWTGLSSFSGSKVWTDGAHIYYSDGTVNSTTRILNGYVLDPSTSTWSSVTFSNLTANLSFDGENVWTDGQNTYYQSQSGNMDGFILLPDSRTWAAYKTPWTGTTTVTPTPINIWTDGSNIYYSANALQYHLDIANQTATISTVRAKTKIS